MTQYVYYFGAAEADGNGKMKELLGGKGANLAEMCLIGLPVPAGFASGRCGGPFDKTLARVPAARLRRA